MILHQLSDVFALKPINDIQTASINTVPDSAQTTILTISASQDMYISRISCSGEVYAKYQLYIDTNLKETKRVSSREVDFIYPNSLLLRKDEILDIKVTHYYIGKTVDFEATIYSRI